MKEETKEAKKSKPKKYKPVITADGVEWIEEDEQIPSFKVEDCDLPKGWIPKWAKEEDE